MTTILSNYSLKDVIHKPFPHIVLENIFPEDVYQKLLNNYPLNSNNLNRIGVKRPKKNTRYQISSKDIEKDRTILTKEWLDLYDNNTSKSLFDDFKRIFGSFFEEYYGKENASRLLKEKNIGKRNIDDSEIFLDFQPGINTPTSKLWSSRVRGPHLDNPVEIFAILIYFSSEEKNSHGGNLEICSSHKDMQKFHGKLEISDNQVFATSTIEYKKNSGIVFLNTQKSIHSITKRKWVNEDRRLLNIIGENHYPLFKTR